MIDISSEVDMHSLETALQFWEPGELISLCVPKKEHIPYLRRGIRRLAGDPDRVVDNLMYYNRVPVQLFSLEGDQLDIPVGAYYVDPEYKVPIQSYGFWFYPMDEELQVATELIALGVDIDFNVLSRNYNEPQTPN